MLAQIIPAALSPLKQFLWLLLQGVFFAFNFTSNSIISALVSGGGFQEVGKLMLFAAQIDLILGLHEACTGHSLQKQP